MSRRRWRCWQWLRRRKRSGRSHARGSLSHLNPSDVFLPVKRCEDGGVDDLKEDDNEKAEKEETEDEEDEYNDEGDEEEEEEKEQELMTEPR